MPPGVHLACFMLRPRLCQVFDVLVPAKTDNQLPTVKLPYEELLLWQIELLERLDNWTVAQITEWLEENIGLGSKIEQDFRRDFLRALTRLVRNIEDPSFSQAKFSARLIDAPCRKEIVAKTNTPKHCFLLSIHMISTIYALTSKTDFDFIPLRSFTVQQQVYTGAADQEAFARQAYLEFAHCFPPGDSDDGGGRSSRHSSGVRIMTTVTQSTSSPRNSQWQTSLPRSEDGSTSGSSPTPEKSVNSPPPSRAIVVSNVITVDITHA